MDDYHTSRANERRRAAEDLATAALLKVELSDIEWWEADNISRRFTLTEKRQILAAIHHAIVDPATHINLDTGIKR